MAQGVETGRRGWVEQAARGKDGLVRRGNPVTLPAGRVALAGRVLGRPSQAFDRVWCNKARKKESAP